MSDVPDSKGTLGDEQNSTYAYADRKAAAV